MSRDTFIHSKRRVFVWTIVFSYRLFLSIFHVKISSFEIATDVAGNGFAGETPPAKPLCLSPAKTEDRCRRHVGPTRNTLSPD